MEEGQLKPAPTAGAAAEPQGAQPSAEVKAGARAFMVANAGLPNWSVPQFMAILLLTVITQLSWGLYGVCTRYLVGPAGAPAASLSAPPLPLRWAACLSLIWELCGLLPPLCKLPHRSPQPHSRCLPAPAPTCYSPQQVQTPKPIPTLQLMVCLNLLAWPGMILFASLPNWYLAHRKERKERLAAEAAADECNGTPDAQSADSKGSTPAEAAAAEAPAEAADTPPQPTRKERLHKWFKSQLIANAIGSIAVFQAMTQVYAAKEANVSEARRPACDSTLAHQAPWPAPP